MSQRTTNPAKKNISALENVDALRKQITWYKSFFDNAADAVFFIQTKTWTVLDANERASSLLHIDRLDLIGRSLPQFKSVFHMLSRSSAPHALAEVSIENEDGETVQVEVSARFVEHDGQRLILAIARDVSDKRALTETLMQADKMMLLGQLSASVAHEIRNPLAAVNLNLQMLQRKLEADEKAQHHINIAMRGVERIMNIVTTTLDFAKPQAPRIEEIDINDVLTDSLELISDILFRKIIAVNLDLEQQLPKLRADLNQMQQVFINLLTNSCDAINAKGEIDIQTSSEVENDATVAILISISDNGCGILAEDLARIFDPFFTRKAEGTGLGLAITHRIVQHHGGTIDVKSARGRGSVFTIRIPTSRA